MSGAIAMRFDSDGLLHPISAYRPELNFGACGAPIPAKRLAAGQKPVGWMGGWSYAIPSTAKHKDAAWELLRWLCSPRANELIVRSAASQARGRGEGFFPALHPNRRIMRWIQAEYVDGNPAISEDMRRAYKAFVELLPTSRHRPVTPVGQRLWSEQIRATDAALNHAKTPYEALNYGKRRTQAALDGLLNPPTGPPVPWRRLIAIYVACVVVLFAAMIGFWEWRRRRYALRRRRWLEGYICASPWLIGFVVFGAGPILFSLVISFCHYDVLNEAVFVGWDNYTGLVGSHYDDVVGERVSNDPLFWRSLANTGFMIIGVPLGILAGMALAMLLNAKVRALGVFRTLYYLPAIVPAVAGFILWIWIFDPTRGLLNQVLRGFGMSSPPNWLQDPAWAKPALILMGLWGVGGGMIIWLAGLKEIPESLYEAARVDGAGPLQRFRHITLPLLTPYIFFHFIMGMIGVFQVFGSAYIMTGGGAGRRDAVLRAQALQRGVQVPEYGRGQRYGVGAVPCGPGGHARPTLARQEVGPLRTMNAMRSLMSARAVVLYGVLVAGAAVFAFPFLWMVGTSFKVNREMAAGRLRIAPELPSPRRTSPYVDVEEFAAPVRPDGVAESVWREVLPRLIEQAGRRVDRWPPQTAPGEPPVDVSFLDAGELRDEMIEGALDTILERISDRARRGRRRGREGQKICSRAGRRIAG